VVRALLLGLVPVAWATGVLTLPLLLAVVVAYGAASLVNDAASMSFLPRLVPRGQLQRAHARIDGADAVAQTAGPRARWRAGPRRRRTARAADRLARLPGLRCRGAHAAHRGARRIPARGWCAAAAPRGGGGGAVGLRRLGAAPAGGRDPSLVRRERRARRRARAVRAAAAGAVGGGLRRRDGGRRPGCARRRRRLDGGRSPARHGWRDHRGARLDRARGAADGGRGAAGHRRRTRGRP